MYATLFVAILVPVFLEATTSASNDQNHDLRWTSALLTYVHCTLVNPVVTILEFVALIAQFRQLQSRSHLGALSTNTLAAQAVVFALVALSWLKRITMSVHIRPSNGHQVLVWYQVVGWAAIDNAIFAFSQAVLWWKARQLPRYLDAENTPLLTAERAV
jgi:hypothetical protein